MPLCSARGYIPNATYARSWEMNAVFDGVTFTRRRRRQLAATKRAVSSELHEKSPLLADDEIPFCQTTWSELRSLCQYRAWPTFQPDDYERSVDGRPHLARLLLASDTWETTHNNILWNHTSKRINIDLMNSATVHWSHCSRWHRWHWRWRWWLHWKQRGSLFFLQLAELLAPFIFPLSLSTLKRKRGKWTVHKVQLTRMDQ